MFKRSRPLLSFITITAAIIGACAGICTMIQFIGSGSRNTHEEHEHSQQKPRPVSNADLTGSWWIENTIHETTHVPFEGLIIGYKVFLKMTGLNTFEGTGEKWTENDKEVSGQAHTPIKIKGSIDANTISSIFWEEGTLRNTTGQFQWTKTNIEDRWIGKFSSTAGASSGSSVLYRD